MSGDDNSGNTKRRFCFAHRDGKLSYTVLPAHNFTIVIVRLNGHALMRNYLVHVFAMMDFKIMSLDSNEKSADLKNIAIDKLFLPGKIGHSISV